MTDPEKTELTVEDATKMVVGHIAEKHLFERPPESKRERYIRLYEQYAGQVYIAAMAANLDWGIDDVLEAASMLATNVIKDTIETSYDDEEP